MTKHAMLLLFAILCFPLPSMAQDYCPETSDVIGVSVPATWAIQTRDGVDKQNAPVSVQVGRVGASIYRASFRWPINQLVMGDSVTYASMQLNVQQPLPYGSNIQIGGYGPAGYGDPLADSVSLTHTRAGTPAPSITWIGPHYNDIWGWPFQLYSPYYLSTRQLRNSIGQGLPYWASGLRLENEGASASSFMFSGTTDNNPSRRPQLHMTVCRPRLTCPLGDVPMISTIYSDLDRSASEGTGQVGSTTQLIVSRTSDSPPAVDTNTAISRFPMAAIHNRYVISANLFMMTHSVTGPVTVRVGAFGDPGPLGTPSGLLTGTHLASPTAMAAALANTRAAYPFFMEEELDTSLVIWRPIPIEMLDYSAQYLRPNFTIAVQQENVNATSFARFKNLTDTTLANRPRLVIRSCLRP